MENKNNNNSLIELLDTVFIVDGEMIEDNGEDSYALSVNESYGMVGVFDGCGGIGSRKYAAFDNKTGAYIASHTAANVAIDWFKEFCGSDTDLSGNTTNKLCKDLSKSITDELRSIESSTASTAIKGSLSKSFPTTASMILFKRKGNGLYSSFIWAGDSRGFVLTTPGLAQITIDDIEENDDALSNLSNDGRLINVISASGDFKLNSRNVICPGPTLLITATDGCFGYFSTPMEFEYMLLDTLSESNSINDWKNNIDKYILKFTGDDYTLGIVGAGFKNFKTLKKMFAERKKELYKDYISRLADAKEDEKVKLWNNYKKNYYRGV